MSLSLADASDDLRHIYLSVLFELRKHHRRRRIVIATSLAVTLPILFYVLPLAFGVEFPEIADSFASRNLGFVGLLIIVSGALFAGDAVSGEIENKTALLLFATPQRRNSIFVGKFIAAIVSTWFALTLYYVVTSLEVAYIYGADQLSQALLKSFLVSLLYSTSVVSVIYFFSSAFRRSITSTLVGFFSLLMILPIVGGVLSFVDVDPWFILTTHGDLITGVFNLAPAARFAGRTIETYVPDFHQGLAVMTAYTVGFLLSALIIANRKEVTG